MLLLLIERKIIKYWLSLSWSEYCTFTLLQATGALEKTDRYVPSHNERKQATERPCGV
jgi:hypothetical protein